MLALQSQDFAAGRYALAQRSGANATRRQIDALFSQGHLVRSWTMRGTLHICLPEDVRWMVRATRERTLRSAAARLRELNIDNAVIDRTARIVAEHLREHGRSSRPAIFDMLNSRGIGTGKQRGIHLLMVLVQNGLICLGPIPEGAKLAAQDFVLVDDWVPPHREPADPLAELLRRYLESHGPATVRDAAWYAGQTLTSMRSAASRLGESLINVGDDERGDAYWVIAGSPAHQELDSPREAALPLRLLGPFDEYYLSYADRSLVADERMTQQILPGKNGMFLPFWLEHGKASKLWKAETAPTERIGAALHQRYMEFKVAR